MCFNDMKKLIKETLLLQLETLGAHSACLFILGTLDDFYFLALPLP